MNLLHIFRTSFSRNTSGGLLLSSIASYNSIRIQQGAFAGVGLGLSVLPKLHMIPQNRSGCVHRSVKLARAPGTFLTENNTQNIR